jgi:hypothetical protein
MSKTIEQQIAIIENALMSHCEDCVSRHAEQRRVDKAFDALCKRALPSGLAKAWDTKSELELTDLLEWYTSANRLPMMSADELLAELPDLGLTERVQECHRVWLNAFCEAWELLDAPSQSEELKAAIRWMKV